MPRADPLAELGRYLAPMAEALAAQADQLRAQAWEEQRPDMRGRLHMRDEGTIVSHATSVTDWTVSVERRLYPASWWP